MDIEVLITIAAVSYRAIRHSETSLGGVNIDITARDFKVIKSVCDVRMDSDAASRDGRVHALRAAQYHLVPSISSGAQSVSGGAAAARGGSTGARGDRRQRRAERQAETPTSEPHTVSIVPQAAGAETGTPAVNEPKPLFDTLRMDVHLTVANGFVIRSNDLAVPNAPIGLGAVNLTLGGDLQVRKPAGRDVVRLVGAVKTVRGTYDFQGRRFTILREGTIRFVGGRDLDPDLNVVAQRTIQGVVANVNIQGTLRDPEIVLSSVPPLEKSEILSLIVFNQPINQLGEGQQVALSQRAEQLAAGAIAGTLTSSLGRALNLTEFNIQAATESGLGAQVTAGQQLNEKLYARLEQGLGDVPQHHPNLASGWPAAAVGSNAQPRCSSARSVPIRCSSLPLT